MARGVKFVRVLCMTLWRFGAEFKWYTENRIEWSHHRYLPCMLE